MTVPPRTLASDHEMIALRFSRAMVLASRRWKALADAEMKDSGQTYARWSAMYWIAYSPPDITHNELAKRVGVRPPVLNRIVNWLAEHGLIRREQVPGDRRKTALAVTPAGLTKLDEIHSVGSGLIGKLLLPIDAKRLEECCIVLEQLTEALIKADEERGR